MGLKTVHRGMTALNLVRSRAKEKVMVYWLEQAHSKTTYDGKKCLHTYKRSTKLTPAALTLINASPSLG